MDNGYMGLGMSTIPFIGVIMDTVVYDNRQLIEEIIDWTYNKQRYFDRNDVQELLGLIEDLVTYCDVHAFNKAKLKEYKGY